MMSNDKEKEINNNDRKTKKTIRWCSWPSTEKPLWEEVVEECKQLEDLHMQRWMEEHPKFGDAMSEYFARNLYHTLIPAFKTMCTLIVQKNMLKDRKQLFDPIDCLAEILYNDNKNYCFRQKDWKTSHELLNDDYRCEKRSRPIYPEHWILTRDEAATRIQALIRGVLSRAKLSLADIKVGFWFFSKIL